MVLKTIDLHDKRIELLVIGINGKIANAVELVQRAKESISNSEEILIQAQLELEKLYMILNEDSRKEHFK